MEKDRRAQERIDFCQQAGIEPLGFEQLPKDASTRTYFRVFATNEEGYVLLDDEQGLNHCDAFVKIDQLLCEHGVHAPKIVAEDCAKGLILLEDLGHNTLTRLLEEGGNERDLYALATQALIKTARIEAKPDYVGELSPQRVLNDINFFADWYVSMAAGLPWSEQQRQEFNGLIEEVLALGYQVPNTLVLWDYHVDNVMLLPSGKECAVLDFQDGLWGPLTYDIMSLVEDARRDVSAPVQQEMKTLFFNSLSGVSREDFDASFAFWSMFRHMRVLGRFSILLACAGKDKYIKFVPHLWEMLNRTLEHPAFAKIKVWLEHHLPAEKRGLPRLKPIRKAMILAAGRGTRMRELTDDCPKPLVKVAGKCLIDYSLEKLAEANIKDVVVNVCYKGEMIKQHLAMQNVFKITFSEEEQALETGGGLKKALPLLGSDPFLSLNSDDFCTKESGKPELWRMMDAWDDAKYDVLLLLVPLDKVAGDNPGRIGNYRLGADGCWERNVHKVEGFSYLFTGWSIVHPRALKNTPDGAFSMRDVYDRLAAAGRLGMVISQSTMFQIGSPEAVVAAEPLIKRH